MKTVGELLDTSLTHFEKRDYRQSEEALDQILTSNPDFHRAWFLKGVICEETGRQAEAEQFFQKGGNTYTMWFRLALQLQEKDPARALPYYDRVLQGDRYSNQAWFNKGLLYERLGRQAEAGNCFRSISPFKEILSRIIIPVGFMCFLVGAGITMVRRAEKTMSLLVFAAAAFCFFWMKRDAGLALEMFLKKRHTNSLPSKRTYSPDLDCPLYLRYGLSVLNQIPKNQNRHYWMAHKASGKLAESGIMKRIVESQTSNNRSGKNMPVIRKAVVAVAGSGTRFLPATKTMPKEMLPIVDKPIIQLVIEELVEAGIQDIILVTKWDKKPLEDHFDNNWALANELKDSGKMRQYEEITRISEMANFVYVRQKGPYGNGTPVLAASSLIENETFVYVWGDDLVRSQVSFTKQMIEDHQKCGKLMIGVQQVEKQFVSRYGIVKLRNSSMEIEDIVEKPSANEAPSQLADFGRMILNQEIIDILREIPLGKDNELWIVDAIRQYVKRGGIFLAKQVEDGEWLTTGDPLNYLKAVIKYALDREEIGEDLMNFLTHAVSQTRTYSLPD